MGLNRMMMGKGEVKVEDGSKDWSYAEADNKTISFTGNVSRCSDNPSINSGVYELPAPTIAIFNFLFILMLLSFFLLLNVVFPLL